MFNQKKLKVLKVVFLYLLAIFFFFSCSKKENKPIENVSSVNDVSEKAAQTVETINNGSLLTQSEELIIVFNKQNFKGRPKGEVEQGDVLSLNPSIEGKLFWKETHVLVFKPNEKWEGQNYKASLDLAKITGEKKLKELDFEFGIVPLSLVSLNSEVAYKKKIKNGEGLSLEVNLEFIDKVDVEKLKKALKLRLKNKELDYKLESKTDKKYFVTCKYETSSKLPADFVTFTIDKDTLGLAQDVYRTINLTDIKDFKVLRVISFQGGLDIVFNQNISDTQDINGLIRLTPDLKTTMRKEKNRIVLEGDFNYGREYTINVMGIKNIAGYTILDFKDVFEFKDQNPQIKFLSDGLFMPSSKNKKVSFASVNVKAVQVKISKVYPSNLGQFLQSESINSNKGRYDSFSYMIDRVGVEVYKKKFVIGEKKNVTAKTSLDLSKLIKEQDRGVYLLELSFTRDDMEYKKLSKNTKYMYGNDYYNNPNSYGYIYRHGKIAKPIVLSDIGLMVKQGNDNVLVWANNIVNASPMQGVKVALRDYQNQIIAEGESDSQGLCSFKDIKGDKIFYVEGNYNNQRSFITPSTMQWNMSSFDTGGVVRKNSDISAYIFNERGIYRPGDTVNTSLILRDKSGSFPKNHPVSLEIFDPLQRKMKSIGIKKSKDGFYSFKYKLDSKAPTGNWNFIFKAGPYKKAHYVRVETIVSEKLKVEIDGSDELDYMSREVNMNLKANWLVGEPASNLKGELSCHLTPYTFVFPKYRNFNFLDQAIQFSTLPLKKVTKQTDTNGEANYKWILPESLKPPMALQAIIKAQVFERGGRSSKGEKRVKIYPYKYYTGIYIDKDVLAGGVVPGNKLDFDVICCDKKGRSIKGLELKYKIYKNDRYWWWEYHNNKLKYKKDSKTRLVHEGDLRSSDKPQKISYNVLGRGSYLLEVYPTASSGHKSAIFFNSYSWANAKSVKSGRVINIECKKKSYNVGETGEIKFNTPQKGNVLFTIEKGGEILKKEVYPCNGQEKVISFNIDKSMVPNISASVAIIQPHENSLNDRPIRMYGMSSIKVVDPDSQEKLIVKTPKEVENGQNLDIEINTSSKEKTQLVVALVDEGLLSISNFQTPSPWKFFNEKEKLQVKTSDLYDYVLNAIKGDISRFFSIGGGMARAAFLSKMQAPQKKERFKAVTYFKGPIETDKNGNLKLSFKMDKEYIGALRLMVVSAKGERYGSYEKIIPVKTKLMILPTLPRVLAPKDNFQANVSVFYYGKVPMKVKVKSLVDGSVKMLGNDVQEVTFNKVGEQNIRFGYGVEGEKDWVKINFVANGNGLEFKKTEEISVINPALPSKREKFYTFKEGEEQIEIDVPKEGAKGSTKAYLTLDRRKIINVEDKLDNLIRYPYGCLEQRVSAVFPQLFLKNVLDYSYRSFDVDTNINDLLSKIIDFQTYSGCFSLWAGSSYISNWSDVYALHFLLEAKAKGYSVDSALLERSIKYSLSKVELRDEDIYSLTYRLFVLSLARKPVVKSMNFIKETKLNKLNDSSKCLLAAAYYLADMKGIANDIKKSITYTVQNYNNPGVTFGSSTRDKALLLYLSSIMGDKVTADKLYDLLVDDFNSGKWLSTQTTGYVLLSIGKYYDKIENLNNMQNSEPINFVLEIDGKKERNLELKKNKIFYQLPSTCYGKNIVLKRKGKDRASNYYISLLWKGIPLDMKGLYVRKGVNLSVDYLDEDRRKINPQEIEKNKTFWIHYRVILDKNYNKVENLALSQILPSGWEIENLRVSKDFLPKWSSSLRLNKEIYQDIRDNRVFWIFHLNNYNRVVDFLLKVNPVFKGNFTLPGAVCESMYSNDFRAENLYERVKVK